MRYFDTFAPNSMKIKYALFLFICASLLLTQCKVFDNEVLVPGYIYVPSYTFSTPTDGSKGDSTSKFLDVWMYSNGNVEGGFGFPALIPIQANGNTVISLEAGISRSGQDRERLPYPLVARFNQTVNLKPNVVDTLKPVFSYYPDAQFKFIEDFDRIGFRFQLDFKQEGDTVIRFSNDSARTPGKNSGMVYLTDSTDYFRMVTSEEYTLSRTSQVYLELDYWSDEIINVGLIAQTVNGTDVKVIPLVNLFPTITWNKVYVDLSKDIAVIPSAYRYKVYFEVKRPRGQPAPRIYFDNIKLIEG